MKKRKKGKAKPRSSPLIPLALIVMLAVVCAIVFFYLNKPASTYDEKIEIYLDRAGPWLENQQVKLRAFSSCGEFDLYLDGENIAHGSKVNTDLALAAGMHTLEAVNERCSASQEISVKRKECEDGEIRQCVLDGCPGEQTCDTGLYGVCVLPKKTCVPGQKISCALDACRFGYKVCNECGTGFGKCLSGGETSASVCTN